MASFRTFYRKPVPVFEPHAENVLRCPTAVLERLRDDADLKLRLYREEVQKDRVLRSHLRDELGRFETDLLGEYSAIRERVARAEHILRQGDFVDALAVDVVRPDAGPMDGVFDRPDADASFDKRGPPKDGAGEGYFGISPSDPSIRFHVDFRGELIATIFGTAQTWSYSFGPWYYKLKRWLFFNPQWRRVYRLSQVDNPAISQELLMGVINAVEGVTVYPTFDCAMTDLEAAACLLAAYHATLEDANMPSYGGVEEVLLNLPRILRSLNEDLGARDAGGHVGAISARNRFSYRDANDMRFFVPMVNGRHYANGTFNDHAVLNALLRRKAIAKLPGYGYSVAEATAEERVSGQPRDDPLFRWTRRVLAKKLGREVPVLVQEQQYLRSGLDAVVALMLLWKVLNSESVFGPRKGKFALSDLLGDQVEKPEEVHENDFATGHVKNFEYVLENYVIKWYERDNNVTLSQLFPGLVLVSVLDSVKSGWDPNKREDGKAKDASVPVEAVAVQGAKVDPVAEYMFTQSSPQQDSAKRLEAHDTLQFHYENGLGRLLSVALPRHRFSALAASLFNALDIYEILYFVAFGFLPVAVTS